MSPISSRKIVPPFAASNMPTRRASAPVNAPFSWPKSSLSSSSFGIAAQFTATNGFARRALRWCSACATSSLPVPLSPRTSTDRSVSATFWMVSKICFIARPWPIRFSKERSRSTRSSSSRCSRWSCVRSSALRTTTRSSSLSKGLGT